MNQSAAERTDNAIARAVRRKELEDMLSGLLLRVAEVKEELNALVPISRIPQELLVEIFYQLGNLAGRIEGSYKWIIVSHVCRYWRATALQHPRLWDHFVHNMDNPWSATWKFRVEHFNRAGRVPLIVKISGFDNPPSSSAKEFVRLMLSSDHVPIRVLKLKLPKWDDEKPRMLGNNSHLKELSFTTWSPLTSSDTKLPALERINIREVQYGSIQPFLKPMLTRVELSYCKFHNQDIISFLSALDNMPNLSALSLTCVAWDAPVNTVIPHVTLSRLRLLMMHCRDDISHIQTLDHLTIPSTTDLRLDILSSAKDREARLSVATFVQALSSLVRRCFIGDEKPMLTGSLTSHYCGKGYRVAAWSQRMELRDMPPNGDPSDSGPKIIVSMYSPYLEQARAYQMLCRALALTRVQVLTVNRISCVVTSSWAQILGGFDEVQVLRVVGPDYTPYLCRALGKLPRYPSNLAEKGSPKLLLPCLRNLALSGTAFRHSSFEDHLEMVQHFGRWFRARSETGYKIPFVTFQHAINLESQDVALFEKFVGQVVQEGDGKTGKEIGVYFPRIEEDDVESESGDDV